MPSALKNQLVEDMKTAMRARDSLRLGVIRYLLSEIKNWEIDNGEQPDEGVQKVIAREVKKMKDALEDFRKGGREDIVTEETAKIVIMESYLPQQMSDEEVEAIVKRVVEAATDKNFGMLMKAVMNETKGQADGSRVSAMVKEALGS
jgi:uncharacterized protein YqeY